MATLFRVEVLVSDRWLTLQGAESLSQPEAHKVRARQASMAGDHRVRIMPTGARSRS